MTRDEYHRMMSSTQAWIDWAEKVRRVGPNACNPLPLHGVYALAMAAYSDRHAVDDSLLEQARFWCFCADDEPGKDVH